MAIKGLSKPICSEYTATGNKVTYGEPYAADHAVEYSFEAETSEDNDVYADNRPQETAAGSFTNGTLTLATADLEPELSKKILGAKEVTRNINDKEVKEIVYDSDQKTPYLGFGIIEEHQIDNVTKYLPVILPKIKFNIPANAANTRGKEIDWQTKEISARVFRSDQVDENYNKPWQITPAEMFDTEEEAEAYIKSVIGSVTPAKAKTKEV